MVDYGGDYTYSSEKGWKKHLEGIIPIIILLIIGVVIAAQMGWISGIPFLDGLFGPQDVHIAVIGDLEGRETHVESPTVVSAPELKDFMDSDLARTYGLYYEQFEPALARYSGDQLLDQFDMVILAGEREFSRPVKDAIGEYIRGGGKMVVIGDAAIEDPDDPLQLGWAAGDMHGRMPVRLARDVDLDDPDTLIADSGGENRTGEDRTLNFIDINHPIVERAGYGLSANLEDLQEDRQRCVEPIRTIKVLPVGTTITLMRGMDPETNTTRTEPAMVESGTPFGGRVMYFSFDPGCTTGLWIETVNYLVR